MDNYRIEDYLDILEKNEIVYHTHYGQGKFVKIRDNKYILVDFGESGVKSFSFPSSINNSIYLEKPEVIKNREKKTINEKYNIVLKSEKNYFKEVKKLISSQLAECSNDITLMKYDRLNYDDIVDGEGFKKQKRLSKLYEKQKYWNKANKEPYFTRINYICYNETQDIYIGKRAITGKVIPWTDDRAIMYYQPNNYINNDNAPYNLKLLRNFDISIGKLFGFDDKINYIDNNYSEKDNILDFEAIEDKFLLKIIESQRQSKQIQDIVASIRKNQYNIITHNPYDNILVLGCAGSGKSMIMMHRLTYIIFRDESIYNFNNSIVISPSKLMNYQMLELAEQLDISKVKLFSKIDFFKQLLTDFYESNNIISAKNNLESSINYDYKISTGVLSKIYSKTFLMRYINKIQNLYNNSAMDLDFLDFINLAKFDLYKSLISDDSIIIEKNISVYSNIFSELKRIIANYSLSRFNEEYERHKNIIKNYEDIESEKSELAKEIKENKIKYYNSIETTVRDYIFSKSEIGNIEKTKDAFNSLIGSSQRARALLDTLTDKLNHYIVDNKSDYNLKETTDIFLQIISLIVEDNLDIQINENVSETNKPIDKSPNIIKERIESILSLFRTIKNDEEEIIEKEKLLSDNESNYILSKKKDAILNKYNFIKKYLNTSYGDNNIYDLFQRLEKITIDGYKVLNTFFNHYEKFLDSEVYVVLDNLTKGKKDISGLDFIFDFVSYISKDYWQIDTKSYFYFELILKLFYLVTEMEYKIEDDKLIMIDEFQDLSYLEITLIKNIYKKGTINYYGDFNQNINSIGVKFNEMQGIDNITKYELNENYRNAYEITNYVNKKLDKKMIPIGLKGLVKEGNLVDFINIVSKDTEKRNVVIVKDVNNFMHENKGNSIFIKVNDFEEKTIISSKNILVLSVQMAKGLEFENVCVLTKGLSKNEIYVAYTRALNILYIIE